MPITPPTNIWFNGENRAVGRSPDPCPDPHASTTAWGCSRAMRAYETAERSRRCSGSPSTWTGWRSRPGSSMHGR